MKSQDIEVSRFYDNIFQYLDDKQSLRQLEDWLVPRLDVLLSIAPHDLQLLINTIELIRAEMSEGHRTEDELRSELREFIQDHPTVAATFGEPGITTSSSNTTGLISEITVQAETPLFSYRRL